MIDFFALALSHGLLALAALRILLRGDLDDESSADRAGPEVVALAVKDKPGLRTGA